MRNPVNRYPLLVVVVATTLVGEGCRSPRRGVRVGATAAELKVTMEGLAPEDTGKSAWIYELSGCLPELNGTLSGDEPNVVSFKAPGIKRDLKGCQLRVKVAEAPSDVRYVAGSEPGVLYWARDLNIKNDAAGALVAAAPLQKMFDRITGDTRGSFTLKVKVKFPAARDKGAVTGSLQCEPAVVGVGSYEGGDEEGELRFLIGADAAQAFSCPDLYLNVDGRLQAYRGELGDSAKFTATPGAEASVGPVSLTKQEPGNVTPVKPEPDPGAGPGTQPPPSSGGSESIQVNTTATDKCNDSEVFDIQQYKCVPKR
jgi:hypothetical protein